MLVGLRACVEKDEDEIVLAKQQGYQVSLYTYEVERDRD